MTNLIWISILVDECNRQFGYESPKVIIEVISKKHYVVMCDNVHDSHGWLWRKWPEKENSTRDLEHGEKEEGMGTMSPTNTGLSMSNSFSSSSKVSFILHNIVNKFWLDSLRFASSWEACHEEERRSEEKFIFIWLETEASSEEGAEDSGFRGIKLK